MLPSLARDPEQAALFVAREVHAILRSIEPGCRNKPRPIVAVHIADKDEILLREIAKDWRKMSVSAPEQGLTREINEM